MACYGEHYKVMFYFSSSTVITGHVSCGYNYFLNCPASSLALLSDQLYYTVTCGLEMLQNLTQDQVGGGVFARTHKRVSMYIPYT